MLGKVTGCKHNLPHSGNKLTYQQTSQARPSLAKSRGLEWGTSDAIQ